MLEHFGGARVLFDAPLVHDDDAIGELERFFLIVRHEHARQPDLLMKAPQPSAQLLPHFCIERAERLVEQQHPGFDRERARERDALALTARELRGIAIAEVVELHQLQQVRHLLGNRLGRGPMRARPHAKTERDVLEHRHVTEERVVLKDEADATLSGLPRRRVLAVEQHRTGVGRLEPGDDAQQRRLAAPRRARAAQPARRAAPRSSRRGARRSCRTSC